MLKGVKKMYFSTFIFIASFSLYESYKVKINQNIKLCVNCKHYEKVKKIPEEFGICKLFSPELNLITGKSLYYPAFVSRKLDKLCGIDGKYYESNHIDMECNENNEYSSITNEKETL